MRWWWALYVRDKVHANKVRANKSVIKWFFSFSQNHIFWWVRYSLAIEPNETLDFVRFALRCCFFFGGGAGGSSISFDDRTFDLIPQAPSMFCDQSWSFAMIYLNGVLLKSFAMEWANCLCDLAFVCDRKTATGKICDTRPGTYTTWSYCGRTKVSTQTYSW